MRAKMLVSVAVVAAMIATPALAAAESPMAASANPAAGLSLAKIGHLRAAGNKGRKLRLTGGGLIAVLLVGGSIAGIAGVAISQSGQASSR